VGSEPHSIHQQQVALHLADDFEGAGEGNAVDLLGMEGMGVVKDLDSRSLCLARSRADHAVEAKRRVGVGRKRIGQKALSRDPDRMAAAIEVHGVASEIAAIDLNPWAVFDGTFMTQRMK
jgi:hypothetical protein